MIFTNEQLLGAILGADSLEELQRMVGPSEEENQRNTLRNRTIYSYYEQFDIAIMSNSSMTTMSSQITPRAY